MLQESSSLAAILGRDSVVANRIVRLIHDKFHLPHTAAFEGIPATAKSLWDTFAAQKSAGKVGVIVFEKGIAAVRGSYSGYFVLGYTGNNPTEHSLTIKTIKGSVDELASVFGQPLHAFKSDDDADDDKPTYWGAGSTRNDPDPEDDDFDDEFDWQDVIDDLLRRVAPIMLRKVEHKMADMNGLATHMLKMHNFKRAQQVASQLHDLKKIRISLEHPTNHSIGNLMWACANMAIARALQTVINKKDYAECVEDTIDYQLSDHQPADYDITENLTHSWGSYMAKYAQDFAKASTLTGVFMKEFEKALFTDYVTEEDED